MCFQGSNLGRIEIHLVAKNIHGKNIVFIALFRKKFYVPFKKKTILDQIFRFLQFTEFDYFVTFLVKKNIFFPQIFYKKLS